MNIQFIPHQTERRWGMSHTLTDTWTLVDVSLTWQTREEARDYRRKLLGPCPVLANRKSLKVVPLRVEFSLDEPP